MCVRNTDLTKAADQTEAVAVLLEALLHWQSCEENRQKEAKGSNVESRKWGSFGAGGRGVGGGEGGCAGRSSWGVDNPGDGVKPTKPSKKHLKTLIISHPSRPA